jgi:hypothetical protein
MGRPACPSGHGKTRAGGFDDLAVAADVVGIGSGIHQIANRLSCQIPHRRKEPIRLPRRAGVDDHHTLVTVLYGDVRAAADEHVHVLLHVHDLDALYLDRLGPFAFQRASRGHLLFPDARHSNHRSAHQ